MIPRLAGFATGGSVILSKLGRIDSTRGITDLVPPEFFHTFIKEPLRPEFQANLPLIGEEQLLIPHERMWEWLGTKTNPDKMVLLQGNINRIKGNIVKGNVPSKIQDFKDIVDTSLNTAKPRKTFVTDWMSRLRDVSFVDVSAF